MSIPKTLRELKTYFLEQLSPTFSDREVSLMLKTFTGKFLGWNSADYMLSMDKPIEEERIILFVEAVQKLKENVPFQHIVGETEFYGLILKSDHRALVPRPETEELVDWILDELKDKTSARILDLCSGSGCIALALKSELKEGELIAAELSSEAINLILENKRLTGLDVEVLEMDVLDKKSYKKWETTPFDCWVSNPPYIPNSEKVRMHANVLDHEPHMALFVEDEDPLLFYREIAQNANLYLAPGGLLFFEIHEDLGKEMVHLLQELNFVNIELRKDLQGKARMMRAQKRKFTS